MEKNDDILDIDDSYLDTESEDTLKDRFLTFKIGIEDYAIEIKYVTEIIGIQKVTHIPNINKYIKGIINLRGIIIPVVEVRLRFGMDIIEYNDRTCIIVVNVNNITVGLIVDEVSEVLNIPLGEIAPSPQTNKGTHSKFIQGIGKLSNQVKIILDVEKLLFEGKNIKTTDTE